MSDRLTRRIIRALIYAFICGVTFEVYRSNWHLSQNAYWFTNFHMAFTAAMINRRPGSIPLILVAFIAVIYALLSDEGMGLGGIALIVLAYVTHRLRPGLVRETFVYEWLTITGVYSAILIGQNLILLMTFGYSYTLTGLMILMASFLLIYPPIAFIIRVILKSRRETELTTI